MKNVMVIEDSEMMRSLIASTVEDMGDFKVVEVANGFEALKVLPKQPVDLIITDINMPDINGLEIVHFVKSHPEYSRIPLIIVSTEQTQDDIQKGLSLGASAYVTKPFEPEDLVKVVRDVLDSQESGKGR